MCVAPCAICAKAVWSRTPRRAFGGLACDPFDRNAVGRILALKRRRPDKGLILIGADADCFAPELELLAAAERQAVESTWPGAVSWVLPTQRFPAWIAGAHAGCVAVRVPGHAQARAICAGLGRPLGFNFRQPNRPSANGQSAALPAFGFRAPWISWCPDTRCPDRGQANCAPWRESACA